MIARRVTLVWGIFLIILMAIVDRDALIYFKIHDAATTPIV